MKLICKLLRHKYKAVKRLSGGDYLIYQEKCERCGKTVVTKYQGLGTPFAIDRTELDESENVF